MRKVGRIKAVKGDFMVTPGGGVGQGRTAGTPGVKYDILVGRTSGRCVEAGNALEGTMIGFLDMPSGISGDIFLGCLLDAGWPLERLRFAIAQLKLPAEEYSLEAMSVM